LILGRQKRAAMTMVSYRAWQMLVWWAGLLVISGWGWAAPPAAPVDYQQEVRPVLDRYCVRCHGPQKQQANLRLDARQAILKGGISGPAIIPGDPASSALLRAVGRQDDQFAAMPPDGEPLPGRREIDILVAWVAQGAEGPDEELPPAVAPKPSHWAFQPIQHPPVPKVESSWVRSPVDCFILVKLHEHQLIPAPEADRTTLLRRVYLDLVGVLPSVEEIDEFLADDRPDAYERVVDRLLASPHYGERWARRWLDLARYADSNGYTRDMPREIWPYRDWVIHALNQNMPFDQFVIEQLAGDLLPSATLAQRVATGFHRNTLFNEEGGTDPEQFRVERTVDRVNTTGTVFLGLTLACAQCHDHKYDPISQREYYEFFAFFNNVDEPKIDVPTAEQIAAGEPQRRQELLAQIAQLEDQLKSSQEELEKAEIEWETKLTEEEKQKLPFQVLNAIQLARQDRTPELNRHLYEYFKRLPETRSKFPVLEEIEVLRRQLPQFSTTLVVQERLQRRETRVHIRGDFLRPGAPVTPGVPAVLPPLTPRRQVADRLDLARWLVHPQNPLTARVTVNRIWQDFFGRGLVETENDFGVQGSPPSHPELLDWLARQFQQDWDLKRLHRQLVTSAVYRQASCQCGEAVLRDPRNVWLSRQSRLRVDAEVIRDAALSASGLWTRKIGGPSVYPPQPDGVFDFTQDKKPWPTATGADRYRRAMYTYLWRSSPYPALVVFDFPDANATCTRRVRSNTPLQSLALANDILMLECARALARNVLDDRVHVSDDVYVDEIFRRCLIRKPTQAERQRLLDYFRMQVDFFQKELDAACQFVGLTETTTLPATDVARWAAMTSVARVMFNLDEFITRE
jgi:hypothetical protein